jgi:hypothetical protein
MTKILWFLLSPFCMVLSSDLNLVIATGQPWMFYLQTKSLSHTPFCKTYNCTETKFTNRSDSRRIENVHGILGGLYKGPFDKFRSAFYEIIVFRDKIDSSHNTLISSVSISMNPELRYNEAMKSDFRKGVVEPRTYKFINDLTLFLVGKKYSMADLIACFKVSGRDIIFLNENLGYPQKSAINKISTGQGIKPYLKVYCSGDSDLLTIETAP